MMSPDPDDLPPPAPAPGHPDVLAWGRQMFDMREYLDGGREIEATGGCQFEDIIDETEAIAPGS